MEKYGEIKGKTEAGTHRVYMGESKEQPFSVVFGFNHINKYLSNGENIDELPELGD